MGNGRGERIILKSLLFPYAGLYLLHPGQLHLPWCGRQIHWRLGRQTVHTTESVSAWRNEEYNYASTQHGNTLYRTTGTASLVCFITSCRYHDCLIRDITLFPASAVNRTVIGRRQKSGVASARLPGGTSCSGSSFSLNSCSDSPESTFISSSSMGAVLCLTGLRVSLTWYPCNGVVQSMT